MINCMLEEDVEDAACTVDDMKATDRSQSLVQRGGFKGRVGRGRGLGRGFRVVGCSGSVPLRSVRHSTIGLTHELVI